jgi:hypothetical protein
LTHQIDKEEEAYASMRSIARWLVVVCWEWYSRRAT